MADNFNLRTFLSENKLTKNAQILKEETVINGKPVDMSSIEIDGIDMNDYPDFSDAYIAYAAFEDGTELTDGELQELEADNYGLVNDLIHDNQLYIDEEVQDDEKANDIEQAQHDMDRRFEEQVQRALQESRLSAKERRLVEMVQRALGEDHQNADPNVPNDSTDMAIGMMKNGLPEGDEMADKQPLPKYNSIEELMKEIDHGTNKAGHEYKMNRMKEVAEMLEAKVGSLEEGEHAEHIDQKAIKQMRKDILALRKAEEKLRKEFDKKFNKNNKTAAAPKAEKEAVALQESKNNMENFDLRKFLIENKLTRNSRMVNEALAKTYKVAKTAQEGNSHIMDKRWKVGDMLALEPNAEGTQYKLSTKDDVEQTYDGQSLESLIRDKFIVPVSLNEGRSLLGLRTEGFGDRISNAVSSVGARVSGGNSAILQKAVANSGLKVGVPLYTGDGLYIFLVKSINYKTGATDAVVSLITNNRVDQEQSERESKGISEYLAKIINAPTPEEAQKLADELVADAKEHFRKGELTFEKPTNQATPSDYNK